MGFQFQETQLLGRPGDFPTVRHLRLRGTNFEIGKQLAEIAMQRYGYPRGPSEEPLRNRARRLYFQRNYPTLYERMRGVAAAFGCSLEDDTLDLTSLLYHIDLPPGIGGCSVVFYPPVTTANEHGLLSRNYDLSTFSLPDLLGLSMPAEAAVKPLMSEPYIMEVYPDAGYPALYLTCNELLGSGLDGINAEGLMVALLADDETMSSYPMEPMMGLSVGLHDLQVVRLLLETCANVEEAKLALLLNKQYYYANLPHFLVADRFGQSFVWEYSHAHNREYIVDGNEQPLVITNHPVRSAAVRAEASGEDEALDGALENGTYHRYQTLCQRIAAHSGGYTREFLKEANAFVFFDERFQTRNHVRTLWHGIYDAAERSLEVDFYLRDEADPARPGQQTTVRSDYFRFQLAG